MVTNNSNSKKGLDNNCICEINHIIVFQNLIGDY